ncbi:MAG: hypothetical protein WCW04_03030 [Candidatus Paceibacterota bacterium]|jgi:Tfp pilus assembly protein PilW
MKFNNNNKKAFTPTPTLKSRAKWVWGFSIIEIVIYIAIFTALSIVVINSFIIVLSSFSTIRSNHDLLNSGSIAMEKITREIRQADSIDILNSTDEILQLNSTDNSSNPVVVKFAKVGNALNLYRNGTLVGNLLTSKVTLTSISFIRTSNAKSEGEKIKMVLNNTAGKINKTENFYDTVILRGTY